MMFLSEYDFIGYMSIPFIIIVAIPAIIACIYLVYLILDTMQYRVRMNIHEMNIIETTDIPNYEPAIMAYLVNMQRIGKREICSTIMDLIAKKNLKIDLIKGFVSDNNGEYQIKLVSIDNLNSYEFILLQYLFQNGKSVITQEDLHNKLYKGNMKPTFYRQFLKCIQLEAKKKDFFSKRYAKKKSRIYKFVNGLVTTMATIASFFFAIIGEIDDFDEIIGALILMMLVSAGILWALKFIISFMYNLTCYYNDFSKNGLKDYKKWKGFKKYLTHYSSIKDHPIMGITIWQRYYAYAIGLNASNKFFKQMKNMKIADSSIDIKFFEKFNEIIDCIGVSTEKVKSVSIDEYGGSHIEC